MKGIRAVLVLVLSLACAACEDYWLEHPGTERSRGGTDRGDFTAARDFVVDDLLLVPDFTGFAPSGRPRKAFLKIYGDSGRMVRVVSAELVGAQSGRRVSVNLDTTVTIYRPGSDSTVFRTSAELFDDATTPVGTFSRDSTALLTIRFQPDPQGPVRQMSFTMVMRRERGVPWPT